MCRFVGAPVGRGSVKPCAASATRRAAASERRSRVRGTTGILAGVQLLIRDARPDDARRFEEIRIAGWKSSYRGLFDRDFLAALAVEDERVALREEWLATLPAGHVMLVAEVDRGIRGGAALPPATAG